MLGIMKTCCLYTARYVHTYVLHGPLCIDYKVFLRQAGLHFLLSYDILAEFITILAPHFVKSWPWYVSTYIRGEFQIRAHYVLLIISP